MTSYKINPVKATCWKYDGVDHGIQGINDTCFGICGAFSGTSDPYNMDPVCTKACEDLVEKRKLEIFGVGSCDHQVPYKPVLWDEVPRYVPQLLKQGLSPSASRAKCKELCSNVTNLVAECRNRCDLDYNAIESYKSQADNTTNNKVKSKDDPFGKIIAYTLLLALFLGILFIFLVYYVFKKRV